MLGGPFVILGLRADRAWVSREDLSINRIFEYETRKIYRRVSSDSRDYPTTVAVASRPSNQAADLVKDSVRSGSCQRNTG